MRCECDDANRFMIIDLNFNYVGYLQLGSKYS